MRFNWMTMALAGAGVIVGTVLWLDGGIGRGPSGGVSGAALLRPEDANVVARGEKIYAANCASCHGANLEGQPGWRRGGGKAPPHDASGHTWHHPDGLLLRITREGTIGRMPGGAMPGFGGTLSEADMIAVLSFIKSRWPPRIRAAHERIDTRAAQGG